MRRAYWIGAGGILVLFVVDRVTRAIAFSREPADIIPGLLRSVPTTNTGIAFGVALPVWVTFFLVIALLAVVIGFARRAWRQRHVAAWIASLAIASGAVSNVLDRVAYGYVRDFLQLHFWPTTANLGDWLITIGAVVLILASMPRRHTRTLAS